MTESYSVARRLKQHKLRREARRGKIFFRRLYKLIRFVFVIFIFYAVYRLSATHFWYLPEDITSDKNSQHIEILGNDIVSNKKIKEEIKKCPIAKLPLYKINPEEITKKLEELAPVKRAYIRRFWIPARLVVMVEEETPAIIIAPTENSAPVAAYSTTGKFITREYLPLKNNKNVAKILSYGTQEDDYDNWDLDKITTLYNINDLIEDYAEEEVQYIDLRQPHNVFVQLETVKIRLGELDNSAFERIRAIHDILPQLNEIKENIKYIDLSWKESRYLKLKKDLK